MEILIYPIVILSILAIPNCLFQRLELGVDKCRSRIKRYIGGQYALGNELYNQTLMITGSNGELKLANYKFYTTLTISICKQSQEFGSPVKKPLDYIRKALLKDLRGEKLISGQKKAAFGVFFCASLITWGFSIFTLYLFDKSWIDFFSFSNIVMLVWQLVGVVSFCFVFEKMKNSFLSPFDLIFSRIYSFSLLSSVGLSLNQTIQLSELSKFYEVELKGLNYFKDRLRRLIELRQNHGLETGEELELLIEQIWGFYQDKFEALKKRVQVIKFVWLCLFFLMTYLVSIYTTMKSLM